MTCSPAAPLQHASEDNAHNALQALRLLVMRAEVAAHLADASLVETHVVGVLCDLFQTIESVDRGLGQRLMQAIALKPPGGALPA